MHLNRCVLLFSLSVSAFLQAATLEGTLAFSGKVTEPTCTLALTEYRSLQDAYKLVSGYQLGTRMSAVTLNLNQCPKKTLGITKIFLGDAAGKDTSLYFIYNTGGRMVKNSPVDPSSFIRTSPFEVQLPLIVAQLPLRDAPESNVLVQFSYD